MILMLQTYRNLGSSIIDSATLSQIFGYISIFCWVVVFVPQLLANYKNKSSDSVSIPFVLFWALGDIFNLAGCIGQELVMTTILLAIYYLFSDFILLSQLCYYRYFEYLESKLKKDLEAIDETNHLLHPSASSKPITYVTLPLEVPESSEMSFSQNSIHHPSPRNHGLSFKAQFPLLLLIPMVLYVFYNGFDNFTILVAGNKKVVIWAQACGWISTLLFCVAKVPQIILNYKRKSTEGLSMLMFVFCCMGNLTQILSLVIYEHDIPYLIRIAPWLAGAALPFIFDFIIFGQFFYYRQIHV